MPVSEVRRRRSARLSHGSADDTQAKTTYIESIPSKTTTANGNKKRKLNRSIDTQKHTETKEERLSHIVTDFNFAVRELFALKEYKSIVYYNPADYSHQSAKPQIPDQFEDFIKDEKYKLVWDEEIENDKELETLPLRFQKKILADREKALIEKFPFRNNVIERSNEIESSIINRIEDRTAVDANKVKPKHEAQPKIEQEQQSPGRPGRPGRPGPGRPPSRPGPGRPPATTGRRGPGRPPGTPGRRGRPPRKEILNEEDEDEIIEEIGDEEQEQEQEVAVGIEEGPSSRFKSIKFTIPPSFVTHPSHIPKWKPEKQQKFEKMADQEEHKIVEFDPSSLSIIQSKDETILAPEVSNKLQSFLDNEFKTPIIDEANMPDFNYTAQEYESIMQQQESMFKSIQHKITVENSLELNVDKLERRKVVLPQTSTRLTDPFRSTATLYPKSQGVQNTYTHHDHLISQGIAFSKVHQQMRRQHQLRTRKVAQMIEQHFKKKKGEKERLSREREQNLKRISRMAMQAVRKRWNQAYKVYKYIQNEKEEELKQIKGREHLSQMLEHSTQLLEAQLNPSSREQTADITSADELNRQDSDNFSSSSDEEETSKVEDLDDMNLSIEQLKMKYATMDVTGSSTSASENEASESGAVSSEVEADSSQLEQSESEDDGDETDVSRGLASLYGVDEVSQSPAPVEEYTKEQLELIDKLSKEAESSKDPLLDSDESSDMSDSEMSDVDEEDETMEGEEEEQEANANGGLETPKSGLASLFNGAMDENESSEAEDFEMSDEQNESEDEFMSSSENESDQENGDLEKNGHIKPNETEKEAQEDDEDMEVINGSKVRDVPIPSLLRGTLRPYQKQGLNWLASLYNNNTNGILADEMGLGKTIQTISLLSYLACEHHIWGPHLIIVPTSVMLNWEMEFKKFAPGFKLLTYYGSPQQRAQKRKGWNRPDAFHVCITSYQLVVQDQQSFKRRRWRYMILDEAHNIKNFRSTRWRALLNFNTENRLLLTGTPLQNNLIELWSLLYFLMPSSKVNQAMPEGFANLDDFQQWFGKPVDKILEQTTMGNTSDIVDENERTTSKMDEETRNTVSRLHQVLRPYLLRRLKKDVEKQMPGKYEHIVYCRLSNRQRFLYDDFMSRAKTKETLASGNFLSIINCLMQLRKVCNHPDLFEVRPIVTSFAMPRSVPSYYQMTSDLVTRQVENSSFKNNVDFTVLNLDITNAEGLNCFVAQSCDKLKSSKPLENQVSKLALVENGFSSSTKTDVSDYVNYYQYLKADEQIELREKLTHALYLNSLRCGRKPIYGQSLHKFLTKKKTSFDENELLNKFLITIPQRVTQMSETIEKFSIITPSVVALDMKDQLIPISTQHKIKNQIARKKIKNPFHKSQVKLSIAFPDKSLLQYDCGKLQKLASLLQKLTSEGHRALIFTQMTKVLDILEQFLNIHGYRYMRLDGATKIEDRQLLTEKFNRDPKIPVFILSTRSGGLGINLTGADTVIFYDSDWNPAMDKQCQDRCHRIGQVRDVHIYRFVSEYTIESNILKKANQKKQLDNVVIQEGEFTTDYFGKFSVKDLVSDPNIGDDISDRTIDFSGDVKMGNVFAQAEDEEDRVAAGAALKEVAIDDEDFQDESKSVTAAGTPAQTPAPDALSGADEEMDVDFEEGIGHIDEYMLRFISDGYYF
ncbi:SWR1 [[Candida] subhashii]|uniref:Helicase SWR1 n=1 Tax=[Candida] subhashii TaxID=561895 RepID=A0A8J5UWA5_9ASCO|nr:SWR1 [[Candida] subhashii]KAG7662840.1 SWR1 [[Candida] subhashii]